MVNDDIADIQHCCDKFCKQANYFFARFGHLLIIIKRSLYQNFCLFLYGFQLRNLLNKGLQKLAVALCKAIRRVR